jgi:hypothetical protein
MGGLLAARVLADFYETVTVVERDKLPDAADHRRGVPQGRQFHALWSRGAQELEALFPGIRRELVAAAATVCDDGDLSQVSIRVSGHELNRSGKFKDPADVAFSRGVAGVRGRDLQHQSHLWPRHDGGRA